ncbi:MAG: chorismate-binding protein [Phormidesmis sp.]
MDKDEPLLSPCPQYFWRSHSLRKKTGSDIFAALFLPRTTQPRTIQPGVHEIATLLESPDEITSLARYSVCAGAPRWANGQCQMWTPQVGELLPFLKRLGGIAAPLMLPALPERDDDALSLEHLPFTGGWLGWLGYDFAWEIEHLPWLKEDSLPFPVGFWYEPAAFAVLDHQTQQLWLAAESEAKVSQLSARLDRYLEDSDAGCNNATDSGEADSGGEFSSIYVDKNKEDLLEGTSSAPTLASWLTEQPTFETAQAEFQQAVKLAKSHIRAGDVFQVNHSLRFQAQTTLSSWDVYKRLHRINPSPFASYWHTPWGAVVSCSPERLVLLQGRVAQSRPIAGTRPRGKTPAADAQKAEELRGDRKEQAEHIMLVDLERNDLGRVCEWGSVQVDELMTIERYSHVMHLVSNVVGHLQQSSTPADLIAALFPGGTITGCPKVRCMEIIESLEPVRRSLFYGSCGYFDRRGRLDLKILIRTLLMSCCEQSQIDGAATVWGQVGAGIVADSDPEKEWSESLQKAKAQLLALGL